MKDGFSEGVDPDFLYYKGVDPGFLCYEGVDLDFLKGWISAIFK